jgi:hypothetical protein
MITPVDIGGRACASARFARRVIMACARLDAMHAGRMEITNWSIALNCGEEDTSRLRLHGNGNTAAIAALTSSHHAPQCRGAPVRVGSDGGREWNATMKSGLTLTELDQRIAAIRENLRELAEQAAADSGAGNEDLNAARIAEQEKALAELTELREASLRK